MPIEEKLLESVKNNTYKGSRFEISYSSLRSQDITELFIALNHNKEITTLTLFACGLRDQEAEILAQCLISNTTLRVVRLSCNEIGDEGAKHISDALKINQTIKSLYIQHNRIGDAGIAYLVEAIRQNNNIINIDFNFDHPGDKIIRPLMEQNRLLRKKLALNFLTKAVTSAATVSLSQSPAKQLIPSMFHLVPSIADFLYGHGIFGKEKFWQQLQSTNIQIEQKSYKKKLR